MADPSKEPLSSRLTDGFPSDFKASGLVLAVSSLSSLLSAALSLFQLAALSGCVAGAGCTLPGG